MMELRSLAVTLVLGLALVACDPIYTLGTRMPLSPAPTADCLGAALRSSARRTDFRPLGDSEAGAGFLFAVSDTTASRGWRDATIRLEADSESTRVLTMTYVWMGTAHSVPVAEQREMVALAASVLAELQSACAPGAQAPVECFARGFGGAPACRTSPSSSHP